MATDTRNIQFVQTGDADFRAWIAAVIAQLIAVGLTQTADTGQIDTATVTRPGVTNTQAGYAVFRFNDTAHSTRPIFFRLGFGTGSATTTPSIWVTMGTSSDGAGTIGSQWRAALQRSISASTSAVSNYATYDTATGTLAANWISTASNIALIIARTCDPVTELPDDKGVVSHWASTSGDLEFAPWSTLVNANMPFTTPPVTTVAFTDTDGVPVVFKYWGYNISGEAGWFTLPGILMVLLSSQFPSGMLVTVAPAGVDRTYRAFTHGTTFPGAWSLSGPATERLLWVWE